MNQKERDIQRKLRILRYAEEVGSAVKACRYFGIGRASFYRWKVLYKNDGEADVCFIPVLRIATMNQKSSFIQVSQFVPRDLNPDS